VKLITVLHSYQIKKYGRKLKIKISIADRVYPLTVELNQEEGLRSASKKIDVMKQFEENYAVRDKQDVLAMCVAICISIRTKQIDNAINGDETIERIKKSMPS
jgi:cell division protein ZapA